SGVSCGSGPRRSVMSRDYKGLRDRLSEGDRQRRVLVSERGQEGGHEAVPRDLAHRGQHAFVEGRLAELLARKVDLDSDDLDHMPPQNCEMRFAHRLHGNALHSCWFWFARPAARDVLTQETECSPQLARLAGRGAILAGGGIMPGAPPPPSSRRFLCLVQKIVPPFERAPPHQQILISPVSTSSAEDVANFIVVVG